MATSNETRVRVDGLSKIIASVWPASGSARGRARARRAFSACATGRACAAGRATASRKDRGNGGCRSAVSAHSAAPRRACAISPASSFVQAADSRFIASPTSASPTISGGSSRTTFSPAATASKFSLAQAATKSRVRHQHADAEQQALAAHLGDQRRMPVVGFPASRCLNRSPVLLTRSRKPGSSTTSSTALADRHRQRIAAEGRAVRAGGHALGRRLRWPGTRRPESRRRCPWRSP